MFITSLFFLSYVVMTSSISFSELRQYDVITFKVVTQFFFYFSDFPLMYVLMDEAGGLLVAKRPHMHKLKTILVRLMLSLNKWFQVGKIHPTFMGFWTSVGRSTTVLFVHLTRFNPGLDFKWLLPLLH